MHPVTKRFFVRVLYSFTMNIFHVFFKLPRFPVFYFFSWFCTIRITHTVRITDTNTEGGKPRGRSCSTRRSARPRLGCGGGRRGWPGARWASGFGVWNPKKFSIISVSVFPLRFHFIFCDSVPAPDLFFCCPSLWRTRIRQEGTQKKLPKKSGCGVLTFLRH